MQWPSKLSSSQQQSNFSVSHQSSAVQSRDWLAGQHAPRTLKMTGRGERYGGKGLLKTCDHDRSCIEVEYFDLGRTCSRMLLATCSERYCMSGSLLCTQ